MQPSAGDILLEKVITSYKNAHNSYIKISKEINMWLAFSLFGVIVCIIVLPIIFIFDKHVEIWRYVIGPLSVYGFPLGFVIVLKYKQLLVRKVLNENRKELESIYFTVCLIKSDSSKLDLLILERTLMPNNAKPIPIMRDQNNKSWQYIINFKEYDKLFLDR